MRTTNEILDAAKTAIKADSDYRLAKELETNQGHITNWRAKKSQPNNEMVYKLALMLDEDPAVLLAEVEHDFAKSPERAAWWADFLGHVARRVSVVVLLVSGAGFVPGAVRTPTADELRPWPQNVYWVQGLMIV